MKSARPLPPCSAPGCGTLARSSGAEYCEVHYYRMRRNGTLEAKPLHKLAGESCFIEGCGKPAGETIGETAMCDMHATRVRRHGDPGTFTHQRNRNVRRGSENPSWVGSDITYAGTHTRVRLTRGKASGYACIDCGSNAEQWSYDHADPAEKTSEFGPYSVDLNHYEPRCVRCHKRFDLAFIGAPPEDPQLIEAVRRLRAAGVGQKATARELRVSTERVQRIRESLGLPNLPPGKRRAKPDGETASTDPYREVAA